MKILDNREAPWVNPMPWLNKVLVCENCKTTFQLTKEDDTSTLPRLGGGPKGIVAKIRHWFSDIRCDQHKPCSANGEGKVWGGYGNDGNDYMIACPSCDRRVYFDLTPTSTGRSLWHMSIWWKLIGTYSFIWFAFGVTGICTAGKPYNDKLFKWFMIYTMILPFVGLLYMWIAL